MEEQSSHKQYLETRKCTSLMRNGIQDCRSDNTVNYPSMPALSSALRKNRAPRFGQGYIYQPVVSSSQLFAVAPL